MQAIERTPEERAAGILQAQRLGELRKHEAKMKQSGLEYLSELRRIRDEKLQAWRATHESFDAYCRERHGFGERRFAQMLDAGEMRLALLAEAGEDQEIKPVIEAMNEDAMRPLKALPKAEALNVLREAIKLPSKQARKKVTLAKIKLAKARVIAPTIDADTHKPVAKSCPHCGQPMP